MTVVVGIDGGGTKTHAIAYLTEDGVLDAGRPLGDGAAGPCNMALMPPAEAADAIGAAIAHAAVRSADIGAICAAVAGYAFASRREPFLAEVRRLFPSARVRLAPDYLAAFRGALPVGRGVMTIAGTGSVAYASDGGGLSHRVGAYGYLIDDAGSGYGIGRGALAAVLRSMDGSGEPTLLADRIAAAVDAPGWDALIEAVYGGALDRVRIAALSQIVAAVASEGDAVATKLLMHAGEALGRLAEAAYSPVFGKKRSGPVEFALSGSLWRSGTPLLDGFTRSVLGFAPDAHIAPSEIDPATGAARLAADLMGVG